MSEQVSLQQLLGASLGESSDAYMTPQWVSACTVAV